MDAAAAAAELDGVLQVKHLVVKDVFEDVTRDFRVVKDLADDDGIVGRVIVTETIAGMIAAPCELRSAHESVKEAAVKVVEDFLEMVVVSAGGVDVLAPAKLAQEPRL